MKVHAIEDQIFQAQPALGFLEAAEHGRQFEARRRSDHHTGRHRTGPSSPGNISFVRSERSPGLNRETRGWTEKILVLVLEPCGVRRRIVACAGKAWDNIRLAGLPRAAYVKGLGPTLAGPEDAAQLTPVLLHICGKRRHDVGLAHKRFEIYEAIAEDF